MSKTWTKGSRASTSMSLANTKPRAKHRMIQKRPVTSCRPEAISPVRGEADHSGHAGDLPALLVNEDNTAQMSVVTNRVDVSELVGQDGAAVIIHSDADNYANVPDCYLEGQEPDDGTLSTGDAGDRLACGVIEG